MELQATKEHETEIFKTENRPPIFAAVLEVGFVKNRPPILAGSAADFMTSGHAFCDFGHRFLEHGGQF